METLRGEGGEAVRCPRCDSNDVLTTTMGGPIGVKLMFDDVNWATCGRCNHKGKAGDWERLEIAYATVRDLEAKLGMKL